MEKRWVLRRVWKGPRVRARNPDISSAEGWRISFGRVFHRSGAVNENENERFPVSSLSDGLKRVMTEEERVDLWLVGMVRSRRR